MPVTTENPLLKYSWYKPSEKHIDKGFTIVELLFPIISALLLPLYIWMNQKNRRKDEKNPDFPVNDFIFKITTTTLSVMIALTISTPAAYCLAGIFAIPSSDLNGIFRFLSALYHLLRVNVTLTVSFLLSLLALLKFFFPKIGVFISAYQKKTKILMLLLIVASSVVTGHFQILLCFLDPESQKNQEKSIQRFLFFMPLGMIPSTLLYLFVVKSQRNVSKTYPERYLENQIQLFFLTKLLLFPFLEDLQKRGLTVQELWETEAMRLSPDPFQKLLNESHVTLLLIQLTYVFSYRKNLKDLCCKKTYGDSEESGVTVEEVATTTV